MIDREREILQDTRYRQMKRNLKQLSKGDLIKILFDTHSYLELYKNKYLEIIEKLKERSSEKENNDESNVIESVTASESIVSSGDNKPNAE
jgi:hypothetical protein